MKKCHMASLLLCLLSTHAFADAKEYYYQKQLQQKSPRLLEQTVTPQYFEQLIDHAKPSTGTFSQRYYIDESYGKTNDAPVFFYICGESTCHPQSLNGAIREHAKRFHAKLVVLEHRFYGKSQPFDQLTTANLRYLSTANALNDLARFQQSITEQRGWSGKWVAFGGSYPGSLSAYYRLTHPELVVGALASSAPVKAKANFEEYDAHVTKVVGPICAAKMREVVKQVESARGQPDKMESLKQDFDAADIIDDSDFLYAIADVGAAAAQYGMKDQFCQDLENAPTALEGYIAFEKYLSQAWQMRMVDMTAQAAMNEDPNSYYSVFGMRQWMYQSCTEYGYWQNANHIPSQSTRSSSINAAYHQGVCYRLFGIDTPVDTSATNALYYQPLFDSSVSRIYFTNGEQDPWSNLSLTAENANATNPNFSYYTIKDAAHCDDLHSTTVSDNASLIHAREQMDNLIAQWLLSPGPTPST